MKKRLLDICKEHCIAIKNINLDQDIEDIIYDIENAIINRKIYVDNPRIAMADLWRLEQKYHNEKLFNDETFKQRMEEILKDTSFSDTDGFIKCQKFIPCTVIQNEYKTIILNDAQKKKIENLGYGITEYKIRKGRTIREVYCTGVHPNLNTTTKQFCLDNEFLELDLNKQNIFLLEELLSHFNLHDCFILSSEKEKITEAINSEKKSAIN